MRTIAIALTVFALAAHLRADDQASELAKQLANPISSLISVPFQANYDAGSGVVRVKIAGDRDVEAVNPAVHGVDELGQPGLQRLPLPALSAAHPVTELRDGERRL